MLELVIQTKTALIIPHYLQNTKDNATTTMFSRIIKSLTRNINEFLAFQRLKRKKVAVDVDTMEPEQIVGIYRILEKEDTIESVALWSCFFNYNEENKKTDRYCNSPVRSKYLSQNYLDNYLFVEAICKNMKISSVLTKLSFCGLRLSLDSIEILNETILKDKVLKELTFNYCLLDPYLIEALMPSLCQNQNIETLNLSCNGLDDKCSYLISKIVSAQSERRDHVVWSYSLRGELPPNDKYKEGLKELILSHNNFSDILASEMILALRNDLYMRNIDLRNNNISSHWTGEFVKLMRNNSALTNLDMRENPGINQKMHRDLALALLRNIQNLKEKGELELENPEDQINDNDSLEIKSKFVKSDVLTIEIPKKCNLFIILFIAVLKKFSQKVMEIKNKKLSSGRNSSIEICNPDCRQKTTLDTPSSIQIVNQKSSPRSQRSRASSKTKATSAQSIWSSKMSGLPSKSSLQSSTNNKNFAYTQEFNLQNCLLSDQKLEPIGEETKNESQTSINILYNQFDEVTNQRNSGRINQIQAQKKGHTQVSSVEYASPQFLNIDDDEDRKIVSINQSAKRLLNYSEEDVLEPLKQKILEKRLVNVDKCTHCKKCNDIQKHFYISESKGLHLAIENYKLRKALQETLKNSNQRPSNDALNLINSQNISSQRQSLANSSPVEDQDQIIGRMDQLMEELNYLAQKVQIIPEQHSEGIKAVKQGREGKRVKNKRNQK